MPNKNFLLVFILLFVVGNTTLAYDQQLQNSGIKTHLTPNTEIKVTLHLNSQLASYSFPLIAFEIHNYIKLVFLVESNDSIQRYTLISPEYIKSIEAKNTAFSDNDSIVFLLSVQKNKILISYEKETVVFHDLNIDKDISYHICLPAENEHITFAEVSIISTQKSNIPLKVIYGVVILFIVDFLIYFYFKYKAKRQEQSLLAENKTSRDSDNQYPLTKASVRLFGEFRVYDKFGTDITRKFSPTLRELFCLLLCHHQDGGVSISTLNYILWFDKDPQSARNNRSVYLAKLKKVLDTVGEHSISRNGEFIAFESEQINIDYYDFINIITSDDRSVSKINSLLDIIKSGGLLYRCEYLWLESIKSNVADQVVDYLEKFLLTFNIKDNPELVIAVANAIFLFDSLDEIALKYKCRAYKEIGNHSFAKQLYANFIKEYAQLYNEDFRKSFIEIMTD